MSVESNELNVLRLALRQAEKDRDAHKNEAAYFRNGLNFIVREFKVGCQGGTADQEIICFIREKLQEIDRLKAAVSRLEAEKEKANAKRKHKTKS